MEIYPLMLILLVGCATFFNILVYQEELEPTTIYYWSQIILSDFPELLECPTLDTIGNYAS